MTNRARGAYCTEVTSRPRPDRGIRGDGSVDYAVEWSPNFVLVAFRSILLGSPLWTAVLAPDEFSLTFVAEAGFWVAAAIGMGRLLLGF